MGIHLWIRSHLLNVFNQAHEKNNHLKAHQRRNPGYRQWIL